VFATGFFEVSCGIATLSTRLTSGAVADFAFFRLVANVTFTEVVMQR
jgi:hypothetical protein